MTEYRETGYGSDRYPPHDGGGPDSGGAVYRGNTRHPDGQESPYGQDDRGHGRSGSTADPTASIRGRVWRPTRGPRAEGANQGHGAPERGWRTSDGGYRSTEGGWRAPYRPYDTGEWLRDQRPDTGPAGTGEIPPSSSGTGEIARYTPPVTGETPRHTGEIVRYRGTGYRDDVDEPRRAPTGRGYSTGAGRGQRRPGDTGETARYPGATNPRTTGEIARYSATPDMGGREGARYPTSEGAGRGRFDTDGAGRRAGAARRHPSDTGETRIPRQRPTSPANHPPPVPQRRALESGRRNDSPELYSYDPLTLGGGESPAMRYDRTTGSYQHDAASGEPPAQPDGRDPRRAPRPPDPRAAAGPRAAPSTAGYEARAIEARAAEARAAEARAAEARSAGTGGYDSQGYNGRSSGAGRYGGPRYQREPAPGPRDGTPDGRPAERRYDQPPAARRAPARPPQRFEGTYPSRSARTPRNVVPPRGRPGQGLDEEDDDAPAFVHTALVTTAWYTIPLLLYTMYVLTLDGSAQAGDGESPRESALNGLLGGMPRVGVALVTSLAVALLIRVISRGWRAATIGFASAVVGGGVATVIFTALTG